RIEARELDAARRSASPVPGGGGDRQAGRGHCRERRLSGRAPAARVAAARGRIAGVASTAPRGLQLGPAPGAAPRARPREPETGTDPPVLAGPADVPRDLQPP